MQTFALLRHDVGEKGVVLLSTDQMCLVLDISKVHLGRLVHDGVLAKADRGKYDAADTVQRYITYRLELLENKKASKEELNATEIRLKKAKAASEEYALEVKQGNYIHKDHVALIWGAAAHALRTTLLGFPSRHAPSLAACGSITEIKEVLDAAIRTALADLSQLDSGSIAPDPDVPLAETSVEIDDQPVGGPAPKVKRRR